MAQLWGLLMAVSDAARSMSTSPPEQQQAPPGGEWPGLHPIKQTTSLQALNTFSCLIPELFSDTFIDIFSGVIVLRHCSEILG